jgi:hypothetical protein
MDFISVLVVLISTLMAVFAALYAYGMSNLQEIKENWVQYRCNPIYMPMAGMVGSDIGTNFTNCTMQSVKEYAGFALDPIYQTFGVLTTIISDVQNSMNDMRSAVSGASSGFLGIITGTFDKLQNTFQNVTQLFSRVRTIIGRLMAVFAVLMNVVSTGVETGNSVATGPIGQAAEFFCFHPDTSIPTKNGNVAISTIKPGDILADGQVVRSVLQFDGSDTPMCAVGSIVVSGNHKIWCDGGWIRVEKHPLATPTESCETLWCLNTDNHTIPIGGFLFKDYEETSSPDILSEFFRKVEAHYGYFHSPRKAAEPEKYCYTGLASTERVILENGIPMAAGHVRIGDILKHGGKVSAVIRHTVTGSSKFMGTTVAPGTWIFCEHGIVPITDLVTEEPREYVQFITEMCQYAVQGDAAEFIVLDDHEIPDDSVHNWRDSEIQKEVA